MKKINYNKEDLTSHNGVSAVIKDKDGKILMQEHKKYGFWTIPVGKVKQNQDVIEGLKKEVFEECNLNVLDCREIIYKDIYYIRNKKRVLVKTHIFEITKYIGNMGNKEPEKHLKQEFLDINEIKNLSYLSDTTILYLKYLGIKRKAKI